MYATDSLEPRRHSPRQDSVLAFVTSHPGTRLNDIFHGLRARETGITYESIRAAIGKLIASGRVTKVGSAEVYLCELYPTAIKETA